MMNDFSIGFLEGGAKRSRGILRGSFLWHGESETFLSSLMIWTKVAYEGQWRGALADLVNGESNRAVLVTNVEGNGYTWMIRAYTLHRLADDIVRIRERLWMPDMLPEFFDPTRVHSIVEARLDTSTPVSEWDTSIPSVADFFWRELARRSA